MFYPLQVAATESLKGPIDFMQDRNRAFQERRDVVMAALQRMGLAAERPQATFYVWAEVPKGAGTSRQFCFKVLESSIAAVGAALLVAGIFMAFVGWSSR